MTKLKIDFSSGIIEVEGEEGFVKAIYQDYKERLIKETDKKGVSGQIFKKPESDSGKEGDKSKARSVKQKNTSKRKESYSLVKDLNLSPKGGKKDLKSFYSEKNPSNAMENNAVFVYYLQKELSITEITVDHVYTCYKEVSKKVPGALRQSIVDTSSRKGTIDTKSLENITITTKGENLVELDLEERKKIKDK